jgi:hypothetical protein
MRKFPLVVAIVLSLCGSTSLRAQEYPTRVQIKSILVNRDIVQMVHAKVSESTILQAIKASPTNFNISGIGIAGLKSAGVPEAIIDAMITASSDPKASVEIISPAQVPSPRNNPAPRTDPPPAQLPAQPTYLPEEIGVYVFANGRWIPIEPEVVNWKTGGVLKQMVTLGLDKQHIDGTVRKPHSSFDLTSADVSGKLDFEIRSADGDSASEYQLLRFWEKSDRREFRTVTGGVLHASGGAEDNVIDFSFEKIAAHIYKVQLKNLRSGDYGFLAPGTSASLDAASQGKVYTFHIIE